MGLMRKAMFGATAFAAYKYFKPRFSGLARRTHSGLSATFATREQADLAVEHLVQEHRVDRTFIYVEPVGDRNSAGTQVSGGDHASGESGSRDRADGSLHGAIQVTVPLGQDNKGLLTRVLRDAGAKRVEAF